MPKRRLLLAVILLAVALPICAIAALFFVPVAEPFAATTFDRQEWLAGTLIERGRMARDLESSGRLIELRREEVVELLGVPNWSHDDSVSYEVDIGHRFGSNPWTYWLRIEFDETDRAKRVYLHD